MVAPLVLVVSPHPHHCKPLIGALRKIGVEAALVFSTEEGSRMLAENDIPLVCSCAELPDGDYRSILNVIRSRHLKTRLLVMGEAQECAEYLQAMQAGAYDFLPIPYRMQEVERIMRNALELPEPERTLAASMSG